MSVSLVAAPYGNKQKIFSLDSDVYEAIAALYVDQGLSLPSTTGPYSEAELLLMLDKLDGDGLSGTLAQTYAYVLDQLDVQPKLQQKGVGLSWRFAANLEAYAHTNATDFVGRDTWIRGFDEQLPMLSIGLETWPATSFYGYSELTVGNTNTLLNGFGSQILSTNLLMVAPAVVTDLDFNVPYRAFVAMGGDFWSLQIGRDRLNWGAGVSGNLFVGDNLKYHNMARFTTFGEKFKYTFVTSFFPHPTAYIDVNDADENGYWNDGEFSDYDYDAVHGDGQGDALHGLNMFMAHRLEWRMFGSKVGLALSESIMYQSEENLLDLRILNPAAIFHDYYIRSNANSLMGLELDYTPWKGINIYAQMVVDEFSLPGEDIPSVGDDGYPPSLGYLAGIKMVGPVGPAMGHASFEFAYTDPFLYLRYATQNDATVHQSDLYSLNYVGVIREFTNKMNTLYHAAFIGYKYGGDAIVCNLNGGLKRYGSWSFDANAFYMLHGTFDIYTAWSQTGGEEGAPWDIHTPTTDHPTHNYNDRNAGERNSVSHTLVLGVKGFYDITDSLHGFGQLDYIHIENQGNIAGQDTSDVQLTIGISYAI